MINIKYLQIILPIQILNIFRLLTNLPILILSLLILLNSCNKSSQNASNKMFLQQYGQNLVGIKKQIHNNKISDQESIANQHKRAQSLDINRYRYGNYNKNLRIFFPNYLNKNFPASYPIKRVNFNDINIPQFDEFGIETELKKSYPLVNQQDLQENIRKAK